MNRFFFTILFGVSLSLSSHGQETTDFAYDMYKKLASSGGNLFFSPFSISSALTMTAVGAKGQTFEQMQKTLHLAKEPSGFYMGLLPKLKSQDYQLVLANRLWGKLSTQYQPEFLSRLKENYASELTYVDFAKKPEASRIFINKWVEDNTEKKIQNLLPPLSVTDLTELVITNAIYFKGSWAVAFKKDDTNDSVFHEQNKIKKNVSFMNITNDFFMAKNKQAKLVSLPYKGLDLSLFILMPESESGFKNLESSLDSKYINSLISSGEQQKVHVSIPKIFQESTLDLSDSLKALGMPDAFDSKLANFEGIRKPVPYENRLYLSKVFHKAVFETDEFGSEATAGSAVIAATIGAAPAKRETLEFIADKPFIYFIRHQSSGAILFMGRYIKTGN